MKILIFSISLCASLYYVKEPCKARTKQLCSRSNVIAKPEKKQGKLFEQQTIAVYELPKYKYVTGFPLTNNDYLIIRL